MKKIPEELYKKILENMPICCVDGLLHYGKKIVLFKRAYNPVKNRWWSFGGRLLKGEKLKQAIRRKAKEELGIDIKIEKQIGVYEIEFKKTRQGTTLHNLIIPFLVTSHKKPDFSKAEYKEFTEIKEFDKMDNKWHPYIKQVIKDSGILK